VLAVEEEEDRLPFKDNTFELVINRHESYHPSELKRIIKPGGRFITQQVGGKDNIQLNGFLQEKIELEYVSWDLEYAVQSLREQGFVILQKKEAFPRFVFKDIGAVVFYLKVIEWQIKGFSVEVYREKLKALHEMIQQNNGFECFSHRFFIEAVKPE
jgi:SAM-dependent methyltransferase